MVVYLEPGVSLFVRIRLRAYRLRQPSSEKYLMFALMSDDAVPIIREIPAYDPAVY
jgi:hypothetical protein